MSKLAGIIPTRRNPRHTLTFSMLALMTIVMSGCQSSFEQIDLRVESLMAETSSDLGGETRTPSISTWRLDGAENRAMTESDPLAEKLPTINPSANELEFIPTADTDTNLIIARLNRYNTKPLLSTELDLNIALVYAMANSRDYRFAEEEYVLAGLRLLIERHQWGPRFFNDFSATINGSGDDGLFDTSLSLVNEFRITQRLPYGGTVSARALARATENLHQLVSGEETQSADIILQANIPLLRGAGTVARESRIQAERNLIYQARTFERFRRQFIVNISRDFLNLVVQKRTLQNSERGVESLELVESRALALYRGGRTTRFEAALAENSTVAQRDSLNNARESYRLAVDRFKLRIGMPVDEPVVIIESQVGLPVPDIDINYAVKLAMSYRMDLQNRRDQLADSYRSLQNARNDLLPDLDFDASVTLPTDRNLDRGGANFEIGNTSFQAGITFGLPLDREIERLRVRQSQINLERARRSYEEFRDRVAINVREAVRGIDSALFSLQIQERGIEIAEQRKASIEADPDRATSRDSAEAIDQLLRARDERDRAHRSLEVSILEYLLETGQLRSNLDGTIQPLKGMVISGGRLENDADAPPVMMPENPAPEGGR